MLVLSLDIGLRHTGCAFGETKSGIVMALDTIQHDSSRSLVSAIRVITEEKKVQELIVGMPFLPSGEMGEQARLVQGVIEMLKEDIGLPVTIIDERYTTTTHLSAPRADSDALAACRILEVFLDRKKGIDM